MFFTVLTFDSYTETHTLRTIISTKEAKKTNPALPKSAMKKKKKNLFIE